MDKLKILRDELERRKGDIKRISDTTGLSYDTLLRMKNGEGDPGFSKVATLAEHFGWRVLQPPRSRKEAA